MVGWGEAVESDSSHHLDKIITSFNVNESPRTIYFEIYIVGEWLKLNPGILWSYVHNDSKANVTVYMIAFKQFLSI